jgi:hypothetical protein
MPLFYELYGEKVILNDHQKIKDRKKALCPFTQATCDGGGNRHQTTIDLDNSELKYYFDKYLGKVVPGVCSIQYETEKWIVCPRRIFGFSNNDEQYSVNATVAPHEYKAIQEIGLVLDTEYGVWSEVYLRYSDDDAEINYHFDFILAPLLHNIEISMLFDEYNLTTDESKQELFKAAKTGGYVSGRYSKHKEISSYPDLSKPIIIEVMTASTSGSNTKAGTDIASAFTNAILGNEYKCPGINKRQVWGRMATQLFSKSAIAAAWGGETFWFVQDELLNNIETTTKLTINSDNLLADSINFVSFSYEDSSNSLRCNTLNKLPAGMSFAGSQWKIRRKTATHSGINLPGNPV